MCCTRRLLAQIVAWDIRSNMREIDSEIVLQKSP